MVTYLPFHIDYLMAANLVLLLQYIYTKEAFIIDYLWWISINEMHRKGKEGPGKSRKLAYVDNKLKH